MLLDGLPHLPDTSDGGRGAGVRTLSRGMSPE